MKFFLLLFLVILGCEKPGPVEPTPRPEKTPIPTQTFTPAPSPTFTPDPSSESYFVGVTLDAQDYKVADNLAAHKKKLWARIVFDENVKAKDYVNFVNYVAKNNPVMGELLDSFYVKSISLDNYKKRTIDYIDTLGDKIFILEIGNEVNGEWLGNIPSVIEKVSAAFDISKSKNKKTALTLYYNRGCYEKKENEIFTWLKNLPDRVKKGVDYVLVSYYQEDCENQEVKWNEVFYELKDHFPNSYMGIGESGLGEDFMNSKGTPELIKKSMDRCYKAQVFETKFRLGCFYWYYNKHMKDRGQYWNHLNGLI